MTSRYRISSDHNLCLLEVWGSVTDRQMLDIAQQIWNDPRWRPGMDQINDFRKLDEMIVELNDMRAFIDVERTYLKGYEGRRSRVAVVVHSEIHEAGVSLYAALSREMPHDTRTFHGMNAAAAWIGQDPRVIWPGYESEPPEHAKN